MRAPPLEGCWAGLITMAAMQENTKPAKSNLFEEWRT